MSQSNELAFTEFKEALKDPKRLANGNIEFIASITFQTSKGIFNDRLKVHLILQGYNSCTVSIVEEGDVVNTTLFHTEFWSSRGLFVFDQSTSALTISDKTDKMGKYEVEFKEL